jgi:hypothetical protein
LEGSKRLPGLRVAENEHRTANREEPFDEPEFRLTREGQIIGSQHECVQIDLRDSERIPQVDEKSNPKILPLIEDRSSAAIDDKCGMRFWFYKHEGGKGIVPKKEALALRIGKETHADLATLAETADISEDALRGMVANLTSHITAEDKEFRQPMELLYRRLGWMVAWALYIEPAIRAGWEDIGIEKELILDRGDLWVPCTPDRVLVNKGNPKVICYQEYKTTISAGFKWQQSWRYAIQLHIGIAAVQEEIHKKVSFGRVIGLMKGDVRDGRLHHPYVYGYMNTKGGEWSSEYRSGGDWIPMPVWEYPGGIVNWVKKCGKEVALAQFPHSAPVFLDERMLADWVRRRTFRQKTVRIIKESCRTDLERRAKWFERRTDQCRPGFGEECPYLLPCWNAQAELDPLGTGEFEPREPHHDVELTLE